MKLRGLEGLRGVMCLWVIISHSVTIAALPLYKTHGLGRILANGTYAVDVFIVLSGFVITYLISTKNESYVNYLLRRALRLFPVYLVALGISSAMIDMSIDFLKMLPWDNPKTANRLYLFERANTDFIKHLTSHLFLLHGIIPAFVLEASPYTLMGQAWSLTLELQFYFVAPLVLLIARKSIFLCAALFCILLFLEPIIRMYFGHKSFLLGNMSLFLLGISGCLIFLKKQNATMSEGRYLLLICLFSTLSMLYKYIMFDLFHTIPILIWTAVLVVETSDIKSLFFKVIDVSVNNKASHWVGKISYSAYCLHMVFLYAIGYFLINILNTKDYHYYVVIILTVPLILTLYFSSLTYKFIEKPAIDFGKKLNFN